MLLIFSLLTIVGCKNQILELDNSKRISIVNQSIQVPNYYDLYDRKKFEKERGIKYFGSFTFNVNDVFLKDKNNLNFIRIIARKFTSIEKENFEKERLFNTKCKLIESEQGNNLIWLNKFFEENNSYDNFVYEYNYAESYYAHLVQYVFKNHIVVLSFFSEDRNEQKANDFKRMVRIIEKNKVLQNLNEDNLSSHYLRDFFDM